MAGSVDLRDFVTGFVTEAEEYIVKAKAQLLAIERAPATKSHPAAIRELFRALHTIKGLAAMVGVEPVVEIAHAMEAVLRRANEAGGRLPERAPEPLLAGLAAIERRVRALAEGSAVEAAPAPLLARLQQLEPARHGASNALLELPTEHAAKLTASEQAQLAEGHRAGQRVVQLTFVPSHDRVREGSTIATVRERLSALGTLVRVVPVAVPRSAEAAGGLEFALFLLTSADDAALIAAAGGAQARLQVLAEPGAEETGDELPLPEVDEAPEARRNSLRVTVARVDEALDAIAPLGVLRLRLAREVARLAEIGVDTRTLRFLLDEDGRRVRDLRAAVLRMRLVPLADVLEPLSLLLRGVARATGKSARLEIIGGREELDKAVGDRLLPVLVHLVRNAVDHGLEPPEARARLGKPAEGVVRIECGERSNERLEIVVRDDGRGVSAEDVARRAGRPVPGTAEGLLELLSLPGLSTREEVTETSGRGFGMDIVQRVVVTELGGELTLATKPGEGTAFTLRVPVTVAVVAMFRVVCGEQELLVPIAAVDEILEVDANATVAVPQPARDDGRGAPPPRLVHRRGAAIPLIALGEHFGLSTLAATKRALVVSSRGRAFAFAVDATRGQCEVIVRPLLDPLVKVPWVSGTADLGDGRPTLVLDLFAFAAELDAATGKVA